MSSASVTAVFIAAALSGCAMDVGQDEQAVNVMNLDTSTLLVGHQVADFNTWHPVFTDVGEPLRISHNASGHRLWQHADDADYVNVAVEFPTPDDMIGFATDPALLDEMSQAGVIVETVDVVLSEQYEAVSYVTPFNNGWIDTATLLVRHEVADFATWYPVFTAVGGALRLEHNATGHRLFQDLSNPNNVVVHVEFPTLDDLYAFVSDPALLAEMTQGGVDTSTIHVDISQEYEWLRYADPQGEQ